MLRSERIRLKLRVRGADWSFRLACVCFRLESERALDVKHIVTATIHVVKPKKAVVVVQSGEHVVDR